jgi:nucleoside 2-deoxyribosyltransferase
MKTAYLAHPLDSRVKIREWELHMEATGMIDLFNPFYDATDRTDIEAIDAGRADRYEKLVPAELVARDLRNLRHCDALVGIINGAVSYGTIMEIVYANLYNMPVYLIVTNGHEGHPWLKHHSAHIFTSFQEFEDFLTGGNDATIGTVSV